MKTLNFITAAVGAMAASLSLADMTPDEAPLPAVASKNMLTQINMPPINPWVGDSVYPISHYNSGQTDTTSVHGPEIGKKLTLEDAQVIPVSWVSAPTIKRIGDERFVIASNPLGIIKVRATGEAFDLIASVPYPHMEDVHAQVSDITLDRMRASIDKERASGSDGWLLAKAWYSYWKLNLGPGTMGSGAYQVIDHDGYHYTAYDRTWMVKSFDNNQPEDPMAPVKWVNMLELLPEQDAPHFNRILGITMTYDGHLVGAPAVACLCWTGGGVQKFNWNPVSNEFEEAWVLDNIDGSDWMPPLVSPKSGLVYLAITLGILNNTYKLVQGQLHG